MLAHLALLGATLAGAPSDTLKAVTAARLQPGDAPVVDGRLDEAVWSRAEAARDFVQLAPDAGAPATQPTEAWVAYDEGAIYVALRMHDSRPDSIVAQLARRDASVYSDWVQIAFDSYHDRRTAFAFGLNPRGVKQDFFVFDDTQTDMGWNAVWDGAARVDSAGWTAEFRIPLSQLRYNPRDLAAGGGKVWGFNVKREVARTREETFWAPVLPNVPGLVSRFGEVRGLAGLPAPRRMEVQPYTMGRLTRAPGDGANPFYHRNDPAGAVGADLKYGITSNFTLTATLNPDFGQVEADPGQVNLTAYETFLPEQRPFFVEGLDIFRFGIGAGDGDFGSESLFYTRRIGRAPQGSVRADGWVDAPEQTTILGAAKLTGKTSSGWSVGLLDAVTQREEARYTLGGSPEERSAVVEPLTNYAVARVKRDFRGGKSALGGIATLTHRQLGEGDGMDFLHSAAYAGGVDARHRFGGGNYELRTWVLGSRVEGDSAAILRTQRASRRYFQRPDADHVSYRPGQTSLEGWAASAELLKTGGSNWHWGGIVNARSPGFEVNDLGYERDADQVLTAGFLGYNRPKAGKTFRRWGVNLNGWQAVTFGGERAALGGNVNGHFELRNFWSGNAGVNREQAHTSVRALWGGPSIEAPGSWNTWAGVSSDRRKPVRLSLNGSAHWEDETDGHSWNVSSTLTWRASTRSDLSIRPSYSRNVDAWQFVTRRSVDGAPHYVFGRLDQTTAALTARLNYTFTPDLSLQLYAQPFVSAGGYSDFREAALTADGTRVVDAGRFGDRFRPVADGVEVGSPDFNVKQFRSNAVLRWEYRPGSTLFLVWSQGRNDYQPDGSFRLTRDFGRLFGMDDDLPVRGTNVLLLKVNYWLGM